MKYVDKLLNYFTSNYLNNTRFHHSTLGYLKIFFERNNKLKSTFSSLGNVFRNSKWSDLKAQNIKTSLIKSWTVYFFTLAMILIFATSFLGTYYGNLLCSYFPLLGEAYESFSFLWSVIEDSSKAMLISVYSVWVNLKTQLASKLYNRQEHFYNTFSVLKKNDTQYSMPSLNIVLSENEAKNHAPIEMLYRMAHTTRTVGNLRSAPTLPLDTALYHYDSWNIHECLDDDFVPFWNEKPTVNILEVESTYALLPKEVLEIHQLDIESSNFNKVSSYNIALSLTGLNTQEALKSSKEDRWLLRNSLLSDGLILNSNAFTQSKKLLGVNFLSSENSSKNVWASAKLNSLGSTNTANFLTNIQELFMQNKSNSNVLSQYTHTNNDMSNFNFFEDSRMWLTKKYFFTNQLKNNTKSITPVQANTLTQTSATNSNTLNLLVNIQAQNPIIQLANVSLTLDTPKLVTKHDIRSPKLTTHLSLGDQDLLKLSNLSFLNKLTSSTSVADFNYFSPLNHSGPSNKLRSGFIK